MLNKTDELLLRVLEEGAKRSEEKVIKEGTLTSEEAIPLLLKTQYNHIAHLDEEISAIEANFRGMSSKLDILAARFDGLNKLITIIGAGLFLGILTALLKLFLG